MMMNLMDDYDDVIERLHTKMGKREKKGGELK
jgi:hypothetical protein